MFGLCLLRLERKGRNSEASIRRIYYIQNDEALGTESTVFQRIDTMWKISLFLCNTRSINYDFQRYKFNLQM